MNNAELKDNVLKQIKKSGLINIHDIDGVLEGTFDNIFKVFDELLLDGYIVAEDQDSRRYVSLTTKGKVFLDNGGYVLSVREKVAAQELQLSDRRWSRINIITTVLACFVSALSLWVSYQTYSSSEKSKLDTTNQNIEIEILKSELSRVKTILSKKPSYEENLSSDSVRFHLK